MRARDRWFRALLRLFPAPFRERHGDDMRDAFVAGCAEHAAGGSLALAGFLTRTTVDLIHSGLRERLMPNGRRSLARRGEAGGSGGLISWIDVKLGVRMLAKHPGLTLVSTLALAIGIPVGLAPAHFVDGILAPLPVPDGDRIRALRLWSPARGRAEDITHIDMDAWSAGLTTFQRLGATLETTYNVDASDGGSAVRAAAVTASAFDILRVTPALGRAFRPEDEIAGAENVAIIGYDLWQARYMGDPSIVGRTIRLGSIPHTVIGVMPEGFLFPERQQLWTPLRVAPDERPEDAIPLWIFGRLADDVTDEQARSEFATVGVRSITPERDPLLRPQVVDFAYAALPGLAGGLRTTAEFIGFQTLALIVLLVACANVGMLVFAHTATRAGELAVRTALGASRIRIVAQVFTECLALGILGSAAGLVLMSLLFRASFRALPPAFATALPYWIDWGVTLHTALYALGLGALSAVVAGVVPATWFTGRSVQSTIQKARARRTGARFGGLSGALIVIDVAVAVTAVGFAISTYDQVRDIDRSQDVGGIAAGEFLAASLRMPSSGADATPGSGPAGVETRAARMAITQQELVRRLREEPGVQTVVVGTALPRMEHTTRRVEAEGVALPDGRTGVSIRTARIDTDFFEVLGQPMLAGRAFTAGDLDVNSPAVIVNTTFVSDVLGGLNPIGRRIRFVPWGDGEPGPWKEIVGVVGPLGMRTISAEGGQGVYEPLVPGDFTSVHIGVQLAGDPTSFAPRLRALAGEVDPEAVVRVLGTLDELHEGDWYLLLAASLAGGLLVGVLLAMAASGIYAIMSFAVSERTREIGIRAALGADPYDLIRSVVTRAVGQLGVGVLLGAPLAWAFFSSGGTSAYAGAASTLLVGVAVMVLVGLVACTGPTVRALRVDPAEVLGRDA